jgi:CRP-like cAMP-binding protein
VSVRRCAAEPEGKIDVRVNMQRFEETGNGQAPGTTMASRPGGQNHFVASLSAEDYAAIQGDLREVALSRDDVISEPGDEVTAAYLPLDCILSVITVMKDGAQVESRTIGRESGYGLLNALGVTLCHERTVCQVPGRAVRIPLSALRAAARQRPSLSQAIVQHAQVSFVQLAQSAACNALHPAHARLARWLLMTRDRVDRDVLPLTQEYLSVMLGVQRTTVTVIAQGLQDKGLISYSRGRITLTDLEGLRRRSCECYQAVHRTADAMLSERFGRGKDGS